jgi:hypothetical protein
MQIQKSSKNITNAKSPLLLTKKRAENKHLIDYTNII